MGPANSEPAELEISLHRRGEGGYTVEFRFSQPGSDADVRLGAAQPAPIQLDLIQLRFQTFDPPAYAKNLTESFFADPTVRTMFAEAQASAGSLGAPLRVRLLVGPSAPELHSVYWEMLADAETGQPLFTGEKILLSRYLSSRNMRPVLLKPKAHLTALCAVASPSNLSDYQNMAPIDATREFEDAAQALGEIPLASLGIVNGEPNTTLDNLFAALRAQQPDILYIVCHGAMVRDEAYLWLEDDARRAAVVSGADFVARFMELSRAPVLIVLAACESAGPESAGDARAALGPRLSEAGIPAVVAMQGKVSQATAAEFMKVFFAAVQEDGRIDRAMGLGRGKVRDSSDYWMPALFTRLKSGGIFAAPGVQPSPRQKQRRRILVAGLASLFLVLMSAGLYIWQQPPVMKPGFNVAVAEFGVQSKDGRLQSRAEGEAVSQELFETLTRSLAELADTQDYELLGPADVGVIQGKDASEREENARRMAERINAVILVYGVITTKDDAYLVEPAFFVSDPDFRYGQEIRGPNRLGKPAPLDLNQPPGSAAGVGEILYTRFQVLQNLIKGLSYYYTANYPLSAEFFQQATDLPGWDDQDGKEVVYMMLGSARLRGRNSNSRDDIVLAERAREAFERARQINPDYARAYLGLGSATLAIATRFDPNQERTLFEARDWLLTGLEKHDQPPTAYVPLKTAYELGNVYVLGASQDFEDFTYEQARQYYGEVLLGYQEAGRPSELAWYAGHTHTNLGRLAGLEDNWVGMRSECRLAINELNRINRGSKFIAVSLARAYACVATAETHSNNSGEARDAFLKAIELGGSFVEPEELNAWKKQLNQIE